MCGADAAAAAAAFSLSDKHDDTQHTSKDVKGNECKVLEEPLNYHYFVF